MSNFNFMNIRPHKHDQRHSFEELVCQLARQKNMSNATFYRVEGSGGDGGVEAYWEYADGSKIGYQAKYFCRAGDINWQQVDRSVKTAIKNHPALKRYVIAFACNLTPNGIELWRKHKNKWKDWCGQRKMSVAFEYWDESVLMDMLMQKNNRGRLLYWFDQELFNHQWFLDKFETAQQDLGARFNPEDHVEVGISSALDGLARSQKYKNFLLKWFSEMPNIKDFPKNIAESDAPQSDLLFSLGKLLESFRANYKIMENIGGSALPLEEWTRNIDGIKDRVRQLFNWRMQNSQQSRHDQKRDYHIRRVESYLSNIGNVFNKTSINHISIRSDDKKFLIIFGKAGVGKSHLFADTINKLLTEEAPALLLLGGHFSGGDIRQEFLEKLDISKNRSLEEVLQALDVAGETAGRRCLILIDALNESQDISVWQKQLAGFVEEIKKYKWLALGVSIRNEYKDAIMPDNFRQIAVVCEHLGITSYKEWKKASEQYLLKKGISPHSLPWPPPEFFNFLFLKTCCDALQDMGETEFPRGLRGQQEVIKFYLVNLSLKLRRDFPNADFSEHEIHAAVLEIARVISSGEDSFITRQAAIDVCKEEFGDRGPATGRNWFDVLYKEGVFLDHPTPNTSGDSFISDEKVFRFTFQRFSDHLIVKALLDDIKDIREAVSSSGCLSFLFRKENFYEHAHLYEALSVQIAEKYNKELLSFFPNNQNIPQFRDNNYLTEAFVSSLLWRKKEALNEETLSLVNTLAQNEDDPPFSILIQLATVRDHPWNADFLDRFFTKKVNVGS